MAYTLEVLHTVEDSQPSEWDMLGQGQPFSSYRWYAFGESVLRDDKPVYIIVRSEGVPVARATFWIKSKDVQPVSSPALQRALNWYFDRRPIMICHSPLSKSSGLFLPDSADSEEIFGLMMDVAEKIASQHGVSFLVMDYLSEEAARRFTHGGRLFPLELSEPGTVLPVEWPSFAQYLEQLSKNEYKSYKRALRKAEELGVEVRVEEHIGNHQKTIDLIIEHDRSYNFDSMPWLRRLLMQHNRVDSFWVTAYVGGKMVGCELLLSDGGSWIATALGRDYDYPYVYFVLGYKSIQQVILRGGKALRWGTGAYDYKQRLGFELEDNNYVSFKAQNKFLDWFFRRLAPVLIS